MSHIPRLIRIEVCGTGFAAVCEPVIKTDPQHLLFVAPNVEELLVHVAVWARGVQGALELSALDAAGKAKL